MRTYQRMNDLLSWIRWIFNPVTNRTYLIILRFSSRDETAIALSEADPKQSHLTNNKTLVMV